MGMGEDHHIEWKIFLDCLKPADSTTGIDQDIDAVLDQDGMGKREAALSFAVDEKDVLPDFFHIRLSLMAAS
jgi:hypothetical protein